jgi:cysteine desulfurase/selenocysteine lyase
MNAVIASLDPVKGKGKGKRTAPPGAQTAVAGGRGSSFDVDAVREEFPILLQQVHGKPLVYLDNAATAQKPRAVIDAMLRYYEQDNANIHRGVHELSTRATDAYEAARSTIQHSIGATLPQEIVFVRGATEGINLVAQTFGRANIHAGDEVVISAMEHHSNIVPWQILCKEKRAILRIVPISDAGTFLLDEYEAIFTPRTRLVAVTHVSNVLGTINPIREIVARAHQRGVPVLVDGAQAAPHLKIDVQDLDCDFYVFSGHKLYGPTGIGVLYGRARLLEEMPPYQGGGDMIKSVTFAETIYNDLPYKFEAGTPHIAGAIGLGAAIDYVNSIGIENAAAYEHELTLYATECLESIPQVRIIGTARRKTGVVSFVVEDIHPHDVGTVLDNEGIAIRTGHHCAQPLMQRFGVPATCRASLAFYNTKGEIDALAAGIRKAIEAFR